MSNFPETGQTFGRYRIVGRLGRGGMGVVFRARQTDLNREVALKVLPPEHAEVDEFRERFKREAGVLASVDSPHIITIFEYGEQSGCLFISTQLVHGGDLGDLLAADGPQPVDVALDIVAQLAEGLDAAHAAGVIHRDVKPSNVLLRPTQDGYHAYLCDFGIARTEEEGLTQAGLIVGTFGYLAPERCKGGPASPASDIYSLGCLLVTAVTGQPPYGGTDFQVAQHHVSSPIPQWEETSPALAALNSIVRRSMAKAPEDRYASAQEMRRALLAVSENLSHGAVPVPVGSTVLRSPVAATAPDPSAENPGTNTGAKAVPKRWIIASAVLAAVLAMIGGVSWALVQSDNEASSGDARTTPSPSVASPTTTQSTDAGPTREPTTPADTAPRVESTPSESQPRIRHPQQDLACTGQYVVVLASSLRPDASLTTIGNVMDNFVNAEYPPRYADADSSCANLSQMKDKSTSRWIPYLGTFDDAVSACKARMDYTNTSTYVAELSESNTMAIYCSCAVDSSTLPALSKETASEPVGDDRFWVVGLQHMLADAGYNPDQLVGGRYGDLTTGMVRNLQRDFSLQTTGRMDEQTWDVLKDKVCAQ